jgi:hypothetical protein
MKIRGKLVQLPKPVACKIFRDDDTIVFQCGPVVDFKEFLRLAPEPKPPLRNVVGKGQQLLVDDPKYLLKVEAHNKLRICYMMVKSISYTPDLEWSKVDLNNPDTWHEYEDELLTFLTQPEYNRLIAAVYEANAPTEQRRKEALENFTSTEDSQATTPSQEQEPTTT